MQMTGGRSNHGDGRNFGMDGNRWYSEPSHAHSLADQPAPTHNHNQPFQANSSHIPYDTPAPLIQYDRSNNPLPSPSYYSSDLSSRQIDPLRPASSHGTYSRSSLTEGRIGYAPSSGLDRRNGSDAEPYGSRLPPSQPPDTYNSAGVFEDRQRNGSYKGGDNGIPRNQRDELRPALRRDTNYEPTTTYHGSYGHNPGPFVAHGSIPRSYDNGKRPAEAPSNHGPPMGSLNDTRCPPEPYAYPSYNDHDHTPHLESRPHESHGLSAPAGPSDYRQPPGHYDLPPSRSPYKQEHSRMRNDAAVRGSKDRNDLGGYRSSSYSEVDRRYQDEKEMDGTRGARRITRVTRSRDFADDRDGRYKGPSRNMAGEFG